MTLYKQLSITVFCIFTLVFGMAFYFVLMAVKDEYAATEQQHFFQLADQLSLDLQPIVSEPQWPAARNMLAQQMIEHELRHVSLVDAQGQAIIDLDSSELNLPVPAWFVALISLPELALSMPIEQAATEELTVTFVSAHHSFYRQLWQQAQRLFIGAFLIYLVAVVLACWFIKRLLKPLESVSHSAEDLHHHSLTSPIELPDTQELQHVVNALNEMSSTIHQQFKQQAEVAETIRDKIYRDEVSGLGNRAYFMGQAKAWMDESGNGGLAILSLDLLDEVYLEQGESARDHLVVLCANALTRALSVDDSFVLARLSINEFACLLPGQEKDQLLNIAEQMQLAMSDLVVSPMGAAPAISFIGLVQRLAKESVTELLCRADNALQIARSQREKPIHLIECTEKYNLGRVGWKHLVQDAIHQDLFCFKVQPVFSKSEQKMLHAELFAYILKDGKTFFAGQFMPAVEHFKLGCLFDQYVLKKIPQELDLHAYPSIAVNLTQTSCVDSDFHEWLERFLAQHPELKNTLILELPETVCLARANEVTPLIQIIKAAGFAFGIDQYGRHFQSLNYLKQLLPAYVKVDHSYTNQVDEITGDSEFLAAVCQAATKLAITTVATRVESQSILDLLAGLHIDAYQGFISPPVKLEKFDVPANPPEFQ